MSVPRPQEHGRARPHDDRPDGQSHASAKAALTDSYLVEQFIDNSLFHVYFKDAEGRFLRVSNSLARAFGLDDALDAVGKSASDFFAEPQVSKWLAEEQELIRTGARIEDTEERLLWLDGRRTWALTSKMPLYHDGAIVGTFGISRDITRRKNLEEDLDQSLRLEAIGRLAGGIAHDFNNMLTTISGYAELLAGAIAPEAPGHAEVVHIQNATERAAVLTTQLVAFGRNQVMSPQVTDLNKVVRHTQDLLRHVIGEDVEIANRLTPDIGTVCVDATQVEQVIVNMAVNARDAMPKGGLLTFETREVDLDEEAAKLNLLEPGRYVVLSIRDTGGGIPPDTIDRIFEPFFTTKEVGKGSGLGLSTAYGTIRQSGGTITVLSEQDRGTRFDVYLPRIATKVEPVRPTQPVPTETRGRLETILVVEDDQSVRVLARRILSRYGYRVLSAASAAEALDLTKHGESIDLVLSDVVMPGMTGPELGAALACVRPGMPILYMSGYSAEVVRRNGVFDASHAFIQKPFGIEDLARSVREAIDAR